MYNILFGAKYTNLYLLKRYFKFKIITGKKWHLTIDFL